MKKLVVFLLAAIPVFAQTNHFVPINPYTGDPTGVACTVANRYVQSSTTGQLFVCVGGHYINALGFNGGTVSLPITLPSDPTLALQAATKQYVDTHGTESVGTKLRRLAKNADNNNPVQLPPWTVPAAWTGSATYNQGDVVSNGGNWYVNASSSISCTAAASGGPTATGSSALITDNTCTWEWIGAPTLSSNDPQACSGTLTTSSPFGTYTNFYDPVSYPDRFRVLGGYPTTYRTSFWQVYTFNRFTATPASFGAAYSFDTDAPAFAVSLLSNASSMRFVIDGRLYSVGGFNPLGVDSFAVFTGCGASRSHHVTIYGNRNVNYFSRVGVAANYQIWSPSAVDSVRVAWISDSYASSNTYSPWRAGSNIPQQVGMLLGWDDIWNMSTGGTGYIANSSGANYTFAQRVPEACTRNPNVWVFMGSTNDIGLTPLQSSILATFQAVRACSTAPIFVIGVPSINNAGVSTTESAVSAAVTQFADPNTFFIPIYGDTLPWVTGSWNNSAKNTSTNSNLYIAADNIHPPDIGDDYYARRIATAIRADLPSIP